MKKLLKHLYMSNRFSHWLIQIGLDIQNFYWVYIASDEQFAKRKFQKGLGYPLDLDYPRTLNEKINWLKIHDRSPLHTKCADKYRVREYVTTKIGAQYLVPLFFQTDSPSDLTLEKLPDEPFIIKANHDSSGGIVVKDKSLVNWDAIRKQFKNRLRKNYYYKSKEWQYRDIQPCIIVEKLLVGQDGGPPLDYKVHCFNGKVNMIQVDVGRFTDDHFRNWYNAEWVREPYRWSSMLQPNKYTDPSTKEVEKPYNFKKMLELSEIIAQDFIYARVDWYEVEKHLFFGEITFHHDGGSKPIYPREWDLKLGNKLVLPKVNL